MKQPDALFAMFMIGVGFLVIGALIGLPPTTKRGFRWGRIFARMGAAHLIPPLLYIWVSALLG